MPNVQEKASPRNGSTWVAHFLRHDKLKRNPYKFGISIRASAWGWSVIVRDPSVTGWV